MRRALAFAMTILSAAACTDEPRDAATPGDTAARPGGGYAEHATGNVVEIVARGLTLELPAEVPSGWTTLRFVNETPMLHFAVLQRMPAGRTIADSRADVVPVFQDALDHIVAGRAEQGFAEFGRLPAWFSEVVFFGGPGLVAGGGTGQTTLRLEPGTYVVECYVKTGGRFHSADGMIAQLVVTDTDGGGREPNATATITLSDAGMSLDGAMTPGMQTVRVNFAEQRTHENYLGTDVHIVRLGDGADADAIAQWMDWSRVEGLTTPAPAEFVGGTHEMPAGSTAYVTAELTPGRYAFVAEVPDPAAKGLVQAFEVGATAQP